MAPTASAFTGRTVAWRQERFSSSCAQWFYPLTAAFLPALILVGSSVSTLELFVFLTTEQFPVFRLPCRACRAPSPASSFRLPERGKVRTLTFPMYCSAYVHKRISSIPRESTRVTRVRDERWKRRAVSLDKRRNDLELQADVHRCPQPPPVSSRSQGLPSGGGGPTVCFRVPCSDCMLS